MKYSILKQIAVVVRPQSPLKAWIRYPLIDPIIFKALIAQESSFNPSSWNTGGYAGLTQVATETWPSNKPGGVGGSIGATRIIKKKNSNNKTYSVYIYDFVNDERFDPAKSIPGGMKVMYFMIDRVNHYTRGLNLGKEEKWKLNLASYNAGNGVIWKAVGKAKEDRVANINWDSLYKNSDIRKSYLWYGLKEIYSGMKKEGIDEKYYEVVVYVNFIIKRAKQSNDLYLKI